MIYEDFDGGPNSLNSSQREFIRNQDNAEFGAPNKQNNDKQIRRDTLLEVAKMARQHAQEYNALFKNGQSISGLALDKFAQELERMAGE